MLNCMLLAALVFAPPDGDQPVRGRVLGGLIKEGMTQRQVTRILGRDPDALVIAFGPGSLFTQCVFYADMRLSINYDSEGGKEPRVCSVEFSDRGPRGAQGLGSE